MCFPCANVVMCYDVPKTCGDVSHLLPQITSSKLSKSLLAKWGMERLVHVYMLARYMYVKGASCYKLLERLL